MKNLAGPTRALLIGALVLCAALVVGLVLFQGGQSSPGGTDRQSTTTAPESAESPPATTAPTAGSLPTRIEATAGTEPTAGTETTEREPEAEGGSEAAHTPSSGLPTIAESDLPPEAWDTMQAIYDGGPFEYRQDDSTFFNREGILPDQRRGYYREYTVETPGSRDRGARRIVAGADGDLYYTADHYSSFRQIMERQ